jgi:hypothetical protein
VLQASGEDGNEGHLGKGDEVFVRLIKDGVQATVETQPG